MKLLNFFILCSAFIFLTASGAANAAAANTDYSIIREQYRESAVSINYPFVDGLEDKKIQTIVNNAIATDALRILQDYTAQERQYLTLNIEYEIKWQGRELLSIAFSGDRYLKGALYPVRLFFTTNIDLRDGSRLRLKDVVTVDEELVNKVRDGKLFAVTPEVTLDKLCLSKERLLRAFLNADLPPEQNSESAYSYFTATGVGLSLSVMHAMGDYARFEVNYPDIATNLQVGSKARKPVSLPSHF